MKVEILRNKYSHRLEKEINDWLERHEEKHEIVDIKYTGNGNSGTYSVDEYSAMIIYK